MNKQKLEIEVEVPEGYEAVRFGYANHKDLYLGSGSEIQLWSNVFASCGQYVIIRKVGHWRPATVEDVIRSLQGEDVQARFRESEHQEWKMSKLCGFSKAPFCSWVSTFAYWAHCEVLETEPFPC